MKQGRDFRREGKGRRTDTGGEGIGGGRGLSGLIAVLRSGIEERGEGKRAMGVGGKELACREWRDGQETVAYRYYNVISSHRERGKDHRVTARKTS